MTGSSSWIAAAALLLTVPMVGGCSDESGKGDFDAEVGEGPCFQDDPPDTCGQSCDEDTDCGSGFWCFENECTATCGSGGGCPFTHTCDASRGKCIAESGPCASDTPPDGCGDPCARNSDCPFSFEAPTVCRGSVCTAECFPDTHEGCDANESCDFGVCEEGPRPPDASVDADDCQPTVINPEPVTPTVVLIVDRSQSMDSDLTEGGPSRWDAVDFVLTDATNGLVTDLQDAVRFGMVLYSAENGGENTTPIPPDQCPDLDFTDPALMNHGAINTALDVDTIEDTPTGESVDGTVAWLRGFSEVPASGEVHWNGEPVIFVIATDGDPDTCANPDPQVTETTADDEEARQVAVEAVQDAFDLDIRSFIISVGSGTVTANHLDEMANAGQGLALDADDSSVSPFVAGDQDQLASALSEIVTGELSCTIELDGRITDIDTVCDDSDNVVTLDGTELTCGGRCDADDTEGWCAVDQSHIELRGAACDTLKQGQSTLEATFGCDAFIGL